MLCLFTLLCQPILAQGCIFIDDSLTFKREFHTDCFFLSNTHDIQLTNKSSRIPEGMDDMMASDIVRTNLKIKSNQEILDAFYSALSTHEIKSFANNKMGLGILFDNEGAVVRLSMDLKNSAAAKSIPIEKYGQLYRALKSAITFYVTDTRLYYNYTYMVVDWNRVINREVIFHAELYI